MYGKSFLQPASISLSILFLAVACGSADPERDPGPGPGSTDVVVLEDTVDQESGLDALNGIWLRRGYGEIHELKERHLTRYAITQSSCNLEGEQWGIPGIADESLPLIQIIERSSDEVEAHFPGYAFPLVLTRLSELPERCQAILAGETGVEDGPREIFNVLWDNFNEYYAFFNERNVHWESEYNRLLSQVDYVDEQGLFVLMATLITSIDDGHVYLSSIDESFSPAIEYGVLQELESAYENARESYTKGFETFVDAAMENWFDVVLSYLDSQTLRLDNQMMWSTINGDIGYIQINSMAGFTGTIDEGSLIFTEEVREAAATIDRALADLSDTRQLIIDIRLNRGGLDSVALAMANRFADQQVLALRKAARSQGQEWGQVEAWFDPVSQPYLNPVTLITSRDTASAAEVFAVAMRQLPQVTVVGERTNGALSDVLSITLSNGWEFGLSNEVYRDANGSEFEVVGVVPDIDVPSFRFEDVLRSRDAALDLALSLATDASSL